MSLRWSKKLCGWVSLLFIVSACGSEEQAATLVSPTLACSANPRLLRANESATSSWSYLGPDWNLRHSLDPGDTLLYLDWGSFAVISPDNVRYTAPSFVTESRPVEIVAEDLGSAKTVACTHYLLDDSTFGVTDDGKAVGLVATVYKLLAAPSSFPDVSQLSAYETNVLYDLNLSNRSVPVKGLSALSSNFAVRIQGKLQVPTKNFYRFRLQADNGATLYLDETKAIWTNNGGGTSTTGSVAVPDIELAAGNHTFRLDYYHTSGNVTLRLEWAGRTGTVGSFTFPAFQTVSTSQFSRP